MNYCEYPITANLPRSTYEDIVTLFKYFESKNIPVFPRDGFLLGIIRHNGFLPFDIDPDVAITSSDFSKLYNAHLPAYYYINVQPSPRNIKHLLSGRVPYEFTIKKSCSNNRLNKKILMLGVCLSLVIIYLKTPRKYWLLFSVLVLVIGIILYFILNAIDQTILDGTVFHPKTSNDENLLHQEVERNESHVFSSEYGHSDKESSWTWDKRDIFPLSKHKFYDYDIAVPRDSRKLLLEHYGKNVFDVMYKKEDKNLTKIDISNCKPLPAKLL